MDILRYSSKNYRLSIPNSKFSALFTSNNYGSDYPRRFRMLDQNLRILTVYNFKKAVSWSI